MVQSRCDNNLICSGACFLILLYLLCFFVVWLTLMAQIRCRLRAVPDKTTLLMTDMLGHPNWGHRCSSLNHVAFPCWFLFVRHYSLLVSGLFVFLLLLLVRFLFPFLFHFSFPVHFPSSFLFFFLCFFLCWCYRTDLVISWGLPCPQWFWSVFNNPLFTANRICKLESHQLLTNLSHLNSKP